MSKVIEYYTEYTMDDKRIRIWSSIEGRDMIRPLLTRYYDGKSKYLRLTVEEIISWIEQNLPGVTACQVNQTYSIPSDFLGTNEPKEVIMGVVGYAEWP